MATVRSRTYKWLPGSWRFDAFASTSRLIGYRVWSLCCTIRATDVPILKYHVYISIGIGVSTCARGPLSCLNRFTVLRPGEKPIAMENEVER